MTDRPGHDRLDKHDMTDRPGQARAGQDGWDWAGGWMGQDGTERAG